MAHVTFEPNHPRPHTTHTRSSSGSQSGILHTVSGLVGSATRSLGLGRGRGWAPVSREADEDDIPLGQSGHGVVSLDDDLVDMQAAYARGRRRAQGTKPAFYNALHWRFLGGVLVVVILYVLFRAWHQPSSKRRAQLDLESTFGTDLGCDDAIYYYTTPNVNFTETNSTFLDIPLSDASFKLTIQGSLATGTVLLTWDDSLKNDTAVMEITMRTREPEFDFGVQTGGTSGGMWLMVYDEEGTNSPTNCVRYDLAFRLPFAVQKLVFDVQSVAHIQFEPNPALAHPHVLEALELVMASNKSTNLLMLSADFQARESNISVSAGRVTGVLPLLDHVHLRTVPSASASLDIYPADSTTADSHLTTTSGPAPLQLSYYNPSATKYIDRCVAIEHSSSEGGDMDLDYSSKREGAGLRGKVQYESRGRAAVIDMAPGGAVGGGGCDTMQVECGGDLRMVF